MERGSQPRIKPGASYEAAETPRHVALTIQEQQRQQHEDALDDILAGAQHSRNVASGIHTEVQSQNNMIDDIGRNVMRATSEVEREANKAAAINKLRAKLCTLYVAIALLVTCLIVLSQVKLK
ncbi:hypothetical protein LEN26_020920 [Aphanomyces euteiches]|nr:hypothetical protein LEN26_020920 [Aphanomyces euteiches]KAH9107584.1 hypothetical protein AeMF1_017106 [Aphanomyces euteiches]